MRIHSYNLEHRLSLVITRNATRVGCQAVWFLPANMDDEDDAVRHHRDTIDYLLIITVRTLC